MLPKMTQGQVIFRHWDSESGLDESVKAFESVDELFALCLRSRPPQLVDRVILEGTDDEGKHQTVTLVFQSVTIAPPKLEG